MQLRSLRGVVPPCPRSPWPRSPLATFIEVMLGVCRVAGNASATTPTEQPTATPPA